MSPNSGSFFCACASVGMSSVPMSSPDTAARKPRIIVIRPTPPLSTTPAFFKTGRSSGVFASASSPTAMSAVKNSTKSLFFAASLGAASLIILTTVRMVPSLGLDTAL